MELIILFVSVLLATLSAGSFFASMLIWVWPVGIGVATVGSFGFLIMWLYLMDAAIGTWDIFKKSA